MTEKHTELPTSDRELLELAAKASGMLVLPEPWPDVDGWFFCVQHDDPAMHFRKVGSPHHYAPSWRPLTDDGDALRLAVKLELNLSFVGGSVCASWYSRDVAPTGWGHASDGDAATRRAIVRAAAEIAKAKGETK